MGNNDDSLKQQIYASMDMKDTHELLAIWEANDRESWNNETFEATQAVLQNRGVEIPDRQMMQQYFDRASEYHKFERYEDALAECDQLLELTPDWSAAHQLRGIILEDLYKDDEAIQEYQEAIRLNPSDKKIKKNLDSLLKSKELAENFTDDSNKELTPEGNRDSLRRNIHASISVKDTHELLAIWESDDRKRWNYKIFTEINIVLHERGIEIPNREMMQQRYDRIAEAHQNNHYDEALALCNKLIEMVPDWSQAHNIKGVILEDLEREDEAIQEYQEAVRLDPRNKAARKYLHYAIDYLKAQDNLYTPPPVKKLPSLTFEEKPLSEKPKISRKTYFIIIALVCYTLNFGILFQLSDNYWNIPFSILGIPTSLILQVLGGIFAIGAIYATWKMILELKHAGRLHVLFMDAVFECMFGSIFAIPFFGDPVLLIYSLIIIYVILIAINLQF